MGTSGGAADRKMNLAVDQSSSDTSPTEHLGDLQRNSKDLEKNSISLELRILAQDGRRALRISLI